MRIGCFLSCEEFGPGELVEQARRAEAAGFHALWISDHYHPWNDEQGHSAFVWSVIGALSEATSLPVTTGVTCPTVRIHPAVIAQAAATSGVMLEEAVEVMRTLWSGGQRSHRGRHYTVENARIYDLPDEPPPLLVSGFGPKAVRLAARIGDGFVTTSPDKDSIELYRSEGGKGPVHAGTKVCFMADEDEARATAHRLWPNEALPGELAQILPTPSHFEQACQLVTPEMLVTPVGPDLDAHAASLQEYADAGVDELYVQQIGPQQDAFFTTWAEDILPRFA